MHIPKLHTMPGIMPFMHHHLYARVVISIVKCISLPAPLSTSILQL